MADGRARHPVTGPLRGETDLAALARALVTLGEQDARPADAVESVMEPPLTMLGATEPVADAVAVLEENDALLVLDDGKPVGVLTRQDLLGDIG